MSGTNVDYCQFADDERYLFGVVSQRFATQGWLDAFDVMSIARWKAERARLHVARRLVSRGAKTVDAGARALTSALSSASTDHERFRVVIGAWGFGMPMGSAILTVCFPTVFSVYDIRVCSQLGEFEKLGDVGDVDAAWTGYQSFLRAVRNASPAGLTLRECDLWLWGRSRHKDLTTLLASPGYAAYELQCPRARRRKRK